MVHRRRARSLSGTADEAWAIVFPEELRKGRTERGFDLAGLNAALEAL